MKKLNVQPPRPSKASPAKQSFHAPSHPQQDLTGVRLRIEPIPKRTFDYVMKRDANIFERLAKV